jgi:hypothetical protein
MDRSRGRPPRPIRLRSNRDEGTATAHLTAMRSRWPFLGQPQFQTHTDPLRSSTAMLPAVISWGISMNFRVPDERSIR